MKTKGILFSLSTLALTAALLLSACGSEKKKEVTESSKTRTVQLKPSSTSKKEEMKASSQTIKSQQTAPSEQTPSIASSKTQGRQDASASVSPVTPKTPEVNQTVAPNPSKEGHQRVRPIPTKPKLPSLEEGRDSAKEQASKTDNLRYKGVLAYAAGDFTTAAGSWTDGQDTAVSIGQDGQMTIQTPGGEAVAYIVGSYNYTLDDGHYHVDLTSSKDGSVASLDLIVDKDGQLAGAQIIENGHSHSLTRE